VRTSLDDCEHVPRRDSERPLYTANTRVQRRRLYPRCRRCRVPTATSSAGGEAARGGSGVQAAGIACCTCVPQSGAALSHRTGRLLCSTAVSRSSNNTAAARCLCTLLC
jgi:hypothetical protein